MCTERRVTIFWENGKTTIKLHHGVSNKQCEQPHSAPERSSWILGEGCVVERTQSLRCQKRVQWSRYSLPIPRPINWLAHCRLTMIYGVITADCTTDSRGGHVTHATVSSNWSPVPRVARMSALIRFDVSPIFPIMSRSFPPSPPFAVRQFSLKSCEVIWRQECDLIGTEQEK